MDPLGFFLIMLKAALLSNSGLGNLPSLHADLVVRGWATDRQFAGALVVGQLSPGPTGFWVVSLGFILAGWWGAILALLASVLPPLLILPVDAIYRRYGSLPAVAGFVNGLGLAVVGLVPVVLTQLLRSYGVDVGSVLIALGAFAAVLLARAPNLAVIAAGAVAGLLLYR
jgi:chromate transporter